MFYIFWFISVITYIPLYSPGVGGPAVTVSDQQTHLHYLYRSASTVSVPQVQESTNLYKDQFKILSGGVEGAGNNLS